MFLKVLVIVFVGVFVCVDKGVLVGVFVSSIVFVGVFSGRWGDCLCWGQCFSHCHTWS